MPDYNLGRATGEIIITADVDQANRAIGEYDDTLKDATESAKAQSIVERELTDRRRLATEAAKRRSDAERDYKRVMADSTSTVEDQVKAEEARNKARGEHLQTSRRAADAERAYRAEIVGNTDAVNRFVQSLDKSNDGMGRNTRQMNLMQGEARKLSRELDGVTKSLAGVLGMIAKVGAIGAGGLALGGLGGLLGAGGAQGLIAGIAGIVAVVTQLSGTLALLPAIVGGAVTSIAALKIGLVGIDEAFKAWDDPAKFAEALRKLSPAAQSVMRDLQSFRLVLKGAQQTIQEGLFAPMIADIQPLAQVLIPLLTNGLTAVARVIGEAGHEFATWIQGEGALRGIHDFIQNVANGLRALLPAIRPFSDALLKLSVVGSTFFTEIADSIVKAANSFNAWVQGAASDGSLQRWIQSGINGFKQIWDIIKNLGVALKNVFSFSGGGDILSIIQQITAEFRAWTESVGGRSQLSTFFASLRESGQNLMPILKSLGSAIGTIITTLVSLGNSSAGGAQSLFGSLASSLKELGPQLVAAGPAIGDFMKTVGQLIEVVVRNVGPELPKFFQSFAQSAKDLIGPADLLSKGLGNLMGSLSPEAISVLATLVVSLKGLQGVLGGVSGLAGMLNAAKIAMTGLSAAFTFLVSPAGLIVVAILAVVAAVVLVATHWDETKQIAQNLWDKLKEFGSWVGNFFVGIWNTLASSVTSAWDSIVKGVSDSIDSLTGFFTSLPGKIADAISNMVASAYDWGKNIIQRMIDGMREMIGPLGDAMDWLLGNGVKDKTPNSPPKTGPLAGDGDPLLAGGRITERLASGIEAGAPAVAAASDSVMGGAASSFSSAGVAGKSGGGAGKSGFEQYVNEMTNGMREIASFVQNAFGLFKNVFDIVSQTLKVTASLWNGGDNPMTRKGGIFADGSVAEGEPGKAPIPEMAPKQPAVPQKTEAPGYTIPGGTPEERGAKAIADNPNLDAGGNSKTLPQNYPRNAQGVPLGAPTGISALPTDETKVVPPPAPTAPTQTQGQPPPNATSVPGGAGPVQVNAQGFSQHQKDIAGKIITEGRKRGMTDDQIQAALATAGNESNFGDNDVFNTSGGNASVGGVGGVYQQAPKYYGGKDNVMNEDIAIPAFLDRYKDALSNGWDPLQAATHVQNPQLGVNNQDTDYYNASQVQMDRAASLLAGAGPAAPRVSYTGADGTQYGPNGLPIKPVPGGPGVATNPRGQVAVSGKMDNVPNITIPTNPVDLRNGETPTLGGGPGAQAERRGRGAPFTPVPFGLPSNTDTGGYGNPAARKIFPQWLLDLGDAYGVRPSTYPGHQATDRGGEAGYAPNPKLQTRGVDWIGNAQPNSPEAKKQEEAFAQALLAYGTGEGKNGGLEQIIYSSTLSGKQYGLGGAGNDVSGSYYPQQGDGSYQEHENHVHTRFSESVPINLSNSNAVGAPVDPNKPVPVDIQKGSIFGGSAALPPTVQGQYDPKKPLVGTAQQQNPLAVNQNPNLPLIGSAIDGNKTPVPGQTTPGGPINLPSVQATTEQSDPKNTKSPFDQAQQGMSAVAAVVGDAFTIFDNVMTNIDATAGITSTLVRGFENSEDVMKTIDQVQTFLTTAASIAKLVGDVGGIVSMIGGASGAADFGGTSAAGAAISGIAGIVEGGITAVNQGIDLAQQAYRIVSKYAATFAGILLGGGETGPLGGNVRMLLNTMTGDLYTYSQDNPEQKNIKNLPSWLDASFGGKGTHGGNQVVQQTQLNLYTGANAAPGSLISDTMWLVNNGAATTSVVGGEG